MLSDYKVQWRSAASIKVVADQWRRLLGDLHTSKLSIVLFIQRYLSLKVGLNIKFIKRKNEHEPPARVVFNPLTLEVDERIWRQAQSPNLPGYELARHILAHEIGHIVLHRDQTKAFSNANGSGAFYSKEESSEGQANTFARFFLVSDEDMKGLHSIEELALGCKIPIELARDILSETAEVNGNFCEDCGGFASNGRSRCALCEARSFTLK